MPDEYPFPVAVSQLVLGGTDSREAQNTRAIRWLLAQTGGSVVVVTPQRQFDGESLKRLIRRPGTTHLTWRGYSAGSLVNQRVIHAWPDRKHLNDLWGVEADVLVVIEWNQPETATWIEDVRPVRLLPDGIVPPPPGTVAELEPLPNRVDEILESIAQWAAGYSSGLKWNEEDKLKADMMNCPERWAPVTVAQVRAKCRALKMRPNDVETIAGLLQRRKEGRRFIVMHGYRDFRFD
jgi:hypothetical protein